MQGVKLLLSLGNAQEHKPAALLADPPHLHLLQIPPALLRLFLVPALLMLESLTKMGLRIKQEQLLGDRILLDHGSRILLVSSFASKFLVQFNTNDRIIVTRWYVLSGFFIYALDDSIL